MYLADTSIWVDFLRSGDAVLGTTLNQGRICIHPYIIGELALGSLNNRSEILGLLNNLPQSQSATHDEVMDMIKTRKLNSRGIGYVDCHLLASTILTPDTRLWTRDKRLLRLSQDFDVFADIYG